MRVLSFAIITELCMWVTFWWYCCWLITCILICAILEFFYANRMLHSFAAAVIVTVNLICLSAFSCLCMCALSWSLLADLCTLGWYYKCMIFSQLSISFVEVGDRCIFCMCQDASIECVCLSCVLTSAVVCWHLFNVDDIWQTCDISAAGGC